MSFVLKKHDTICLSYSLLTCLVAVEHGIAEADEVGDVGQEPSPSPLVAVVNVGRVHQFVVLVPRVEPENKI